jgi:hypothetical protein
VQSISWKSGEEGGSYSREGEKAMSGPQNTPPKDNKDWEGFREIDRAIAENRRAEYRWKKAWADPWERRALLFTAFAVTAFIVYVVVYDGLI